MSGLSIWDPNEARNIRLDKVMDMIKLKGDYVVPELFDKHEIKRDVGVLYHMDSSKFV